MPQNSAVTLLSEEIDQLAFASCKNDTMIPTDPERLRWLCEQLIAYPDRIDERKTTNIKFLMASAARTIAHLADKAGVPA